jgi:hypothetical protein
MDARETYLSLMLVVRERFDVIERLQTAATPTFAQAEAAAFHGRKIVEAIAFACLVAIQNGLKDVPRDAKGQWNAEKIFESLELKGLFVLPSPSQLREVSFEEQRDNNVKAVIDGIPERCLTYTELVGIYQALHPWLHEVNPYVHPDHASFMSGRLEKLWADLNRLRLFVERHFISIRGKAFFSVLWDSQDGQTKVVSLSKESA